MPVTRRRSRSTGRPDPAEVTRSGRVRRSATDVASRIVTAPARERWERATTWPLAVLSAVFAVAYSFLVLSPLAHGPVAVLLRVVLAVSMAALAADVVVRTVLESRGRRLDFLLHHPIEVLAVVLPMFRAFRAIRLVERIPIRQTRDAVRIRILLSAAGYAAVFVYFVALATLRAERGAPGATITDLGTALWWACVTVATVGYGDVYPVTVLGRVAAVVLMVGGVAIVGIATALLISYVSDRVARGHHEHDD